MRDTSRRAPSPSACWRTRAQLAHAGALAPLGARSSGAPGPSAAPPRPLELVEILHAASLGGSTVCSQVTKGDLLVHARRLGVGQRRYGLPAHNEQRAHTARALARLRPAHCVRPLCNRLACKGEWQPSMAERRERGPELELSNTRAIHAHSHTLHAPGPTFTCTRHQTPVLNQTDLAPPVSVCVVCFCSLRCW